MSLARRAEEPAAHAPTSPPMTSVVEFRIFYTQSVDTSRRLLL